MNLECYFYSQIYKAPEYGHIKLWRAINDPGGLLTAEAKSSEAALYFICFAFTSSVFRDWRGLGIILCPGLCLVRVLFNRMDYEAEREDLDWIIVQACTILSWSTCRRWKWVELWIDQVIRKSYPYLRGLVTYIFLNKRYKLKYFKIWNAQLLKGLYNKA